MGWEILSELKYTRDRERFFSALPADDCLQLIRWQLKWLHSLDEGKTYFINIPCRIFSAPRYFSTLIPLLRKNMVIELQDPETLLGSGYLQYQQLKKIRHVIHEQGARLWLDDVTSGTLVKLEKWFPLFDGIKIDKSALLRYPVQPLSFISGVPVGGKILSGRISG
ncbi:hypothetical protein OHS39_004907 [Klebsiella aerogenes]|nr:hypothetical protein [Klebsiella aerogenes]